MFDCKILKFNDIARRCTIFLFCMWIFDVAFAFMHPIDIRFQWCLQSLITSTVVAFVWFLIRLYVNHLMKQAHQIGFDAGFEDGYDEGYQQCESEFLSKEDEEEEETES